MSSGPGAWIRAKGPSGHRRSRRKINYVTKTITSNASIAGPVDWTSLGPSELVGDLEQTHHAYLRDALPHLAELLGRVTEEHGDRHPELHDVCATFNELREELQAHLLKEEQVLFPMIREMYESTDVLNSRCGSLQVPLGVMSGEHETTVELLERLRTQTSVYSPPRDCCASYVALYVGMAELEADTHLHIHKEDNVLFAAVLAEELRRKF